MIWFILILCGTGVPCPAYFWRIALASAIHSSLRNGLGTTHSFGHWCAHATAARQTDEMANELQITHWREQGGPGWVSGQDRMDRQLGPLGDLVRERIAPKAGEAVVDVGCGTGQT